MSEYEQEALQDGVDLYLTFENGKFKDREDAMLRFFESIRNLLDDDAEKWT